MTEYNYPPTIQEEMTQELTEILEDCRNQQYQEIPPNNQINIRQLNINFLQRNSNVIAQAGIYFDIERMSSENLAALCQLIRHFNSMSSELQDFNELKKIIKKIKIDTKLKRKKNCLIL